MLYDHEAAVKDFLDAARVSDPERFAVICSKYPVKSRRQLQSIRETEIPVGLHPGKFVADVAIPVMSQSGHAVEAA